MSNAHHDAHGHARHDDVHGGADEPHVHSHDHGSGAPHSTLKGYMTGFFLSVILTAIPFWIVMGDVFRSNQTATIVILAFAFVQIFVHMVYFLHMNTSSEGGWNMLALIFTGVLVIIALSGSLWVMYHMNANMMPPSVHDMRNMP